VSRIDRAQEGIFSRNAGAPKDSKKREELRKKHVVRMDYLNKNCTVTGSCCAKHVLLKRQNPEDTCHNGVHRRQAGGKTEVRLNSVPDSDG